MPRRLVNGERSCWSWRRRRAVRSSGKRGQHRVGWYACPRLTLFATEWSAARRKPIPAAAMHISATISADVKARRLPTSHRRKFPSGNFRSARDFEGAKRVSRGQAFRQPATSPFGPKTAPHASATATLKVRPRLLGIEECPHYSSIRSRNVISPQLLRQASSTLAANASTAGSLSCRGAT